MYFAAIAVAVSLFLGGGAMVATQTDSGEKAAHSMAHAWSDVKANVEGRFDGKAGKNDAEKKADTESNASVKAEGSLNTEGSEKKSSSEASVHTDVKSVLDISF